ncbi:hypothetical protein [Brevibacterium litoralis]|uniref:hypothetical protein n=1 Tax=Brevibacterium litoralis TaxID=3138935 RepID=UPI0032EF1F00
MGGELYPAMSPSSWWVALAVLGLLIAVLLLGMPLWRALVRARRSAGELGAVPQHVAFTYRNRISEVETRWRSGELDDRALAQQLGVVVRDFARSAWDIRIDHLTLRDLRARRIRPIAEVVELLYTAEFSRRGSSSGGQDELRAVKELVGRWS